MVLFYFSSRCTSLYLERHKHPKSSEKYLCKTYYIFSAGFTLETTNYLSSNYIGNSIEIANDSFVFFYFIFLCIICRKLHRMHVHFFFHFLNEIIYHCLKTEKIIILLIQRQPIR